MRKPVIELIDAEMAEVLRHKTEAERTQIANNMWRFARDTIRNILHAEHPEWTPEQLQSEVARRLSHGTC